MLCKYLTWLRRRKREKNNNNFTVQPGRELFATVGLDASPICARDRPDRQKQLTTHVTSGGARWLLSSSYLQTLPEPWQRGPCHTPPCCGWKQTARQCWVHAADPDSSTAAVGWALPTGLLSPVTPCQPSACSAPRRTTGAKVKK